MHGYKGKDGEGQEPHPGLVSERKVPAYPVRVIEPLSETQLAELAETRDLYQLFKLQCKVDAEPIGLGAVYRQPDGEGGGGEPSDRPPKPPYVFSEPLETPALAYLKTFRAWVCWDYVWKDSSRKWDKPPKKTNGRNASSTNPAQWMSYEDAVLGVTDHRRTGLGFVLHPDDDLTGIDIDHCIDPETGTFDPRAQEIINFGETYCEVSPSGNGIRFFALGKIDKAHIGDHVEIYGAGRYLTFTGRHIPGTPDTINHALKSIAALVERVRMFKEPKHAAPNGEATQSDIDEAELFEGDGITGFEHFKQEPKSFLTRVNDAALADIDAWALDLFHPNGKWHSTGAFRITSKELNRKLEEDLSISPNGCYDFGEEHPTTPINIVVDFGGLENVNTPISAALRLCERLGRDPVGLGYNPPGTKPEEPKPEPETDGGKRIDDVVKRLADLSENDYLAKRKAEAKALDIPVLKLDTLVKNARKARNADDPKEEKTNKNNRGFICRDDGSIIANIHQNIRLAIKLGGVTLRLNEFSTQTDADGLPGVKAGAEFRDVHANDMRFLIDEGYHFLPPIELWEQVLINIAYRGRYHPVREYLNYRETKWDGVKRLDTWLIVIAGAEDTPFTRAVCRLWPIAAVRRIRQPGVKFDTMPVFESPQGKNKSTALRRLATRDEWFTDNLPIGADSQETIEQTGGIWIAELGELADLGKRDNDHVRSFLSRQDDKARGAYMRRTERVPRQFVCAGTVNKSDYLKDNENRRFWPMPINEFNLDLLTPEYVDQLWSEAAIAESAGESITLDRKLWPDAKKVQDQRRETTELYNDLLNLLGPPDDDKDKSGEKGWITSDDLWEKLGINQKTEQARLSREFGIAMEQLGFDKKQETKTGVDLRRRGTRYFFRGNFDHKISLVTETKPQGKTYNPGDA